MCKTVLDLYNRKRGTRHYNLITLDETYASHFNWCPVVVSALQFLTYENVLYEASTIA